MKAYTNQLQMAMELKYDNMNEYSIINSRLKYSYIYNWGRLQNICCTFIRFEPVRQYRICKYYSIKNYHYNILKPHSLISILSHSNLHTSYSSTYLLLKTPPVYSKIDDLCFKIIVPFS